MYYRALLKWKPYQKCYNCWNSLVSFIKWQESLSPGKAEGARTVWFANCRSLPQSHSAQCFTLLKNTQSTFSVSYHLNVEIIRNPNLIMVKVTIPAKWAAWNSLKKTVWLLDFSVLGPPVLRPCSSPHRAPLVLLYSAFILVHPSCPSSGLPCGWFKVRISCSGRTGP